jgi:hypothetical protein
MIECPYCNSDYKADLIGKATLTAHLGEVHRLKAGEVKDEITWLMATEQLPEGWVDKAENWWDKSDARIVNGRDAFGDMNIRNKVKVIDAYTQHVISGKSSNGEGLLDTIFPTPEQVLANPNTSPQNKVIIQDFLDQEEKEKDDTDPITDGVNWLKDQFTKEGKLVKIEDDDITLLDEWGEVEAGFVDPETGKLQKEIPDKVQYIDDARYTDAYREDLYGKKDSKELDKTQFVKDFFNLDNSGLDVHDLLDLQKKDKESKASEIEEEEFNKKHFDIEEEEGFGVVYKCKHCGEWLSADMPAGQHAEHIMFDHNIQESHAVGNYQDPAIHKADPFYVNQDIRLDKESFSEERMSPAEHWNQGLDAYGPMGYDSKLTNHVFDDFKGLTWSELPTDIQELYKSLHDYPSIGETKAKESQIEDEVELARDLLKSQKGSDEPLDWQYGGEIGELDEDKEESKKAKSLLDELDELEKHHD